MATLRRSHPDSYHVLNDAGEVTGKCEWGRQGQWLGWRLTITHRNRTHQYTRQNLEQIKAILQDLEREGFL